MKFVVLFEDHPDAGRELRLAHIEAHLSFLSENSASIDAAGPLRDSNYAMTGGLWIVEADNRSEVQKLVEKDPFWTEGLRKSVQILFWQQEITKDHNVNEVFSRIEVLLDEISRSTLKLGET